VKLPESKFLVQQKHESWRVQKHVYEELLLYSLHKFGHQRRRKWMLALVQWPDWYQTIKWKWARHLYTDGCVRTR
jgi:hypothetical protein